jgi:hypothetical protein
VRHTLFLPHIREKALENTWAEKARQKRTNTNLEKYGVEVASSSPVVIEKVLETREKLSNRKSVILLREYTRYFRIKLGEGWYQKTDEWLEKTLTEIQEKYGYYNYEELSKNGPREEIFCLYQVTSRETTSKRAKKIQRKIR